MSRIDSNEADHSSAVIKSFTRDVSANIVANLAASGIIYIVAVAAGYITARPSLLVVAAIFVLPGTISVIMVIFGGFRYVTSGGDSGNITSAKNTIIYAAIVIVGILTIWAGTAVGDTIRNFSNAGWLSGVASFILLAAAGTTIWLWRRGRLETTVQAVATFLSGILVLLAFGTLLGSLIPAL